MWKNYESKKKMNLNFQPLESRCTLQIKDEVE